MTDESVLITNLKAEIETLRTATREAHEVLRDLKQARRECEKYIATEMENIDRRLAGEAKKLIDELGESTKQAMDDSRKKVYAQFDKLAAILMGEDDPNKESLYALAFQKRERELQILRAELRT